MLRAFLKKDWSDLELVLAETQQRDWARLTDDIAEAFGRGARFVTPQEFETQFRAFTRHIKSRPAYFTVVYEAYRADGYDQAVAAAKVALECWPQDADMKREAEYLAQLVSKRHAAAVAAPAPTQASEPAKAQ